MTLELTERGAVHSNMTDKWNTSRSYIVNMASEKQFEKILFATEEVNRTGLQELDLLASQSKEWIPSPHARSIFKRAFIKFIFGGVTLEEKLLGEIIQVIDGFEYFQNNLQAHEFFPIVPYKRPYTERLTQLVALTKLVYAKLTTLHKENLDLNNPRDFFDVLVAHQEEEKFDDLDVKAIPINCFTGGLTSSSQTATWFIAYIAKYPKVQKQLHEELDKVVGRDRTPHLRDSAELKYFNATLNEVQRIRPVAAGKFLHTVTEDIECDGYFFERDTQIILNIYNIQHNSKYWNDPDTFNPDRFLNLDENNPHFLPFSIGPRKCAGYRIAKATIFIYLTFILQRFEIVAPEKFDIPHWNYLVFCEAPDFKVYLKPR